MSTRPPAPGPDKAAAAELRERLRGLSVPQADTMRRVMQLHAAGDRLMSSQWLLQVALQAPDHPEVRLWQGLHAADAGDWPTAAGHLARAADARRDDFGLWLRLATAQDHSDDAVAAQRSLAEAARTARSAGQWLQLSIECDRQGRYDEALAAADAHLALAPDSATGLLQRVRCHKALGRTAEAAADCRALIAADRESARAWFSLVDLKTVALDAAELQRLGRAASSPDRPAPERTLMDFALGNALEAAGEHAQALAALQRANEGVRAALPWDAAGFARRLAALERVFAHDAPAAPAAAGTAASGAVALGGEVIFLVGLPRSGSTLVEQVLASHSRVEGASELPYLQLVIEAESRRRGRPLEAWAAQASAADWARLGQDYLRASARWRQQRPLATDKLPDNWLLIGAVRAMLPGARIVDCRRDAVETCWSCYKQLFAPGLAAYSYDFTSLAQWAAACERTGDAWAARAPHAVRVQHYEALVAEPEREIRALLAFCGLSFEPGCLQSHTAQRAIRTPSALQVRQPMRRTSTPAAGYGALLDPLRAALDAARAAG